MNQSLPPLPCQRLQERAFWAQGICQTLEQLGKGARDLPADLRAHYAATDLSLAQISQTDMNRLWDIAARLTQDDSFGLLMGKQYSSSTIELLALAAASSETVGDGIQRMVRYMPVFSTQVQLFALEDEHFLTLYFEPRGTPHFFHLESVVVQCHKIWRTLENGKHPLVLETRLTSDHEKHRALCEQLIGGRVRFGSKRVAVRMERRLLGNPLPHADAFLRRRLDFALEDMLNDLPNVDFAEQVKQRIRVLVSEREVSEELVATPFNMSPRHLRRKLSETRTTYEKLLDEVRMELAMRLIQEGRLNLGRIAFELGFLDPSSFTRAFRRWTGMSPTAFRGELQGKAAGVMG